IFQVQSLVKNANYFSTVLKSHFLLIMHFIHCKISVFFLFSQIIMLETDKKVCFDEKNPLLTLHLSMSFNITSNLEAVLNFSSFSVGLLNTSPIWCSSSLFREHKQSSECRIENQLD
ncbi:MAG: hypothetical protein RR257_02580, partial [Rikenellaceae bacterium]